MHFLTLLPLAFLVSAAPITPDHTTISLSPRANILAGAPPLKPIPSNCKLQQIHSPSKAKAFSLSPAFSTAHAVYTEYLPTYYNTTYSRQVCLEQCYGFGNPGECVSTLWASNVTYTAYGVQNVGVVCNMFGAKIAGGDLVSVKDGSYKDARATDINCPSTA